MEVSTLTAEPRTSLGTRTARRLRAEGRLPGIIYGHGLTPEAFSISAHDLQVELQRGARLLSLDLGGQKGQYLIKEVQYDYLDRYPVHIDLARVDLDERVKIEVTIELRGTPKGISDGGILEHLLDKVEVECLASNIPPALHPSVVHLGIDDALLIKDLELPDGVVSLTGPEEKVAMVRVLAEKAEKEEEEVEEEEAGAAEPERIGRVAESAQEQDAKSK